jgi:stage V sporulation protein S
VNLESELDQRPVPEQEVEILRVASRSRPWKVAGAIAGVIREGKQAQVQAIGAGAVYQAINAVVFARSYLATDGIDVICLPGFTEVEVGEREITAITLIVEPR